MLALLKRYCLQSVFTLSLLCGLQLPNFLLQYELRLQGQLVEAQSQMIAFQKIADKYFAGDLQALINEHKESELAVFRDEASVIENNVLRVQFLLHKQAVAELPIWQRLWALSKDINQPLFMDTWIGYQATIVLDRQAIVVGLIIAILLMLSIELLLLFTSWSVLRVYRYTQKRERCE